jgi:hypothetical protein
VVRPDVRKIPVDFAPVQAADKDHRVVLNDDADSIISYADPIVLLAPGQLLQARQLAQSGRGLDLLNFLPDAAAHLIIFLQVLEVPLEALSERGVHGDSLRTSMI